MIGALEAIKMTSPCPRDTGLEIVARCSLLVNRLLEGGIVQQPKTARKFSYSKTEKGRKNHGQFFLASLHRELTESLRKNLFNLTLSSRSIFLMNPHKAG